MGISGASNSLWDHKQAFCTKPEQPGTATPLESTCVPQPQLRGLHCLQCPSCQTPGICKHATEQGHLNNWPELSLLVVSPVSQKSPCPWHENRVGTQPTPSAASQHRMPTETSAHNPGSSAALIKKVNSTFPQKSPPLVRLADC